ncbi:MAG: hypothetical protein UX64_C0016G0002 [Microgenomates group bacterium GW2011_GWC2_46_7]|nr:MAG: hypothetical protein UX64_C0016G0002 [Microgenomates group bacterium GW2011_GWC2_46_7]
MSKIKFPPFNKLIFFVGIIICLGIGSLLVLFTRPTPRPADIFVIGTPLEYGDTTLVGTLRKDTPVGEPGTFLLILSDGRPIILDSQGLDNLLGSRLRVEGYLSPGSDEVQGATLAISSLTLDTP